MKGRRVSLHVKHIISWILDMYTYVYNYIYIFNHPCGEFPRGIFFWRSAAVSLTWYGQQFRTQLPPGYHCNHGRRPAPLHQDSTYGRCCRSRGLQEHAVCQWIGPFRVPRNWAAWTGWKVEWEKCWFREILRRKGSLRCGRTVHGNRWKWNIP